MHKFFVFVVREPVLLILLILSAGGAWAFIEVADAVNDGDSRVIDEWLVLSLRDPIDKADPVGPRWFEETMRDITALGGYAILTPLTISVAIYEWIRNRRQTALLVIVATVGGILLSTVLKSAFDRPRPDLVPHGSYVLTKSFPSGHAMMAATIYLTIGAMMAQAEKMRSLKIFFLSLGVLLTVLVGISRLYLGVHWPTDVLAGWAAGATWALICWSAARAIDNWADFRSQSLRPTE
jgi:undecaprenyl-diphosphatase